jgi:hypothetical protein
MTDHMTDRSPGFTRAAGGLSRADGVRRLTRQPIGIQSSPGPRTSPGLPSPGLRSVVQTTVVALVALAAVLPADTASAWCWRPRAYAYGYGWGWRPWCGPRVVATYGCSSYSYSYSYGSSCYGWGGWGWPGYGACGPVFYSGCAYPSVVYGWYPGGLSVGWGFSGYGCGPLGSYGWGPFAAAAPAATTRGLDVAAVAAAPVTRTRPAVRPVSLAANEPQRARAASIGRPAASSTAARMRAGKLVASGDEHLRAGVDDERRLDDALRAYDQAARIAADLPDTHLRRAIVLTAMGRAEDARSAMGRAAAIDARLTDVARGAGADAGRRAPDRDLPPDPVFGDAAPGSPTTLDSRTAALLARIFRPAGGHPVAVRDRSLAANWIAARWQTRDGRPLPDGTERGSSPTRLAAR